MIEIASAIAGMRASFDLARGALAARDESKVQAAIVDMQSKLLDLSTAALSVSEKNAALLADLEGVKAELRDLKDKASERATYDLTEVRKGAFAYVSTGEGQPQHYLCQNCYDSGSKVVLQLSAAKRGVEARLVCTKEPQHSFGIGGALPLHTLPIQRG